MRPPNEFEREVLNIVLVELRRAMRSKDQLTILIDPWVSSGGAYIYAVPNEEGHTYEVPKNSARRPKKGKASR